MKHIVTPLIAGLLLVACDDGLPPGKFKKWRLEGETSAPATAGAPAQKRAKAPPPADPKDGPKASDQGTKAEAAVAVASKADAKSETPSAKTAPAAAAQSTDARPDEEAPAVDPELFAQGQKVFSIHCIACHQASGQGLAGAFPPLVGSEWVLEDPRRPISIVLLGLMGEIEVKGQKWNSVMAPLGTVLKDDEVAAVLTYVRNAWGNQAPAVETAMVKELRTKLRGKGMWNGGEAVNAFVQSL